MSDDEVIDQALADGFRLRPPRLPDADHTRVVEVLGLERRLEN